MNNNRNNRRRGRGNRNQGGNGAQLNRIDSRARGNAPQMLDKYKKRAQDAQHNGDRVQMEYYLQFADHYFRVIADTRLRQEEQRQRRDERWDERGDDGEDAAEFSVESDYAPYEQPSFNRREREDRGERAREDRPREERPREERSRDDRARDDRGREDRNREDRPRRRERERDREEPAAEPEGNAPVDTGDETAPIYEPAANPFVREGRAASRGLRPRREDRRPRREDEDAEPTFDAALLPPAINPRDEAPAEGDEATPAPKKRGRKPKAAPAEAVDEG